MTEGLKEEIAAMARRLYRRGLTTVSGGNISARHVSGSILITRSGPDKGNLSAEDICEISAEGENLSPALSPSMEKEMHLKIYRRRPGINAVIHAHTPIASAFSCTGRNIDTTLTGESYLILRKVQRVAGGTMGSGPLAETAAEAAGSSDVILIENHGPVCLGKTLMEAYNRIEVLEHAARMTLITHLLGGCSPLSGEALENIESLFGNSRDAG